MRILWTFTLAVVLVFGAHSARAAVTITNCGTDPAVQVINKKTVVNLPADDVVIQCVLQSLPGSSKTQVTALSITIDGPNGGAVKSSGKGGQATLLQATAGDILINDAAVTADDGNGQVLVDAAGNVTITAGSIVRSGPTGPTADRVTITAGGTINIAGAVVDGNSIFITATGTVTISPTSTVISSSPRDRIEIVSLTGDVLIAGGGSQGGSTVACCADLVSACQDPSHPNCPFRPGGPGMIKLNSIAELNAFCLCPQLTPSKIIADVEGDILISAPLGKIDVSSTTITAGEDIRLVAQTDVIVLGSTISNCGPKKGVVELRGTTCSVEGATILDDDPETLPTLACTVNGTASLLGTCSSAHP